MLRESGEVRCVGVTNYNISKYIGSTVYTLYKARRATIVTSSDTHSLSKNR